MTSLATVENCSRNPDTDVCKEACTASTGLPTSTPGFSKGFCNNLYNNYCADQANQSRPICACNLPWTAYPGANLVSQSFPNFQEPLCWFNSCKRTGYMKGLPSDLCPKCLQNLTINIGDDVKQADIQNISQSCSSTGASTTTTGSTPSAPVPTAVVAPTSSSTSTWIQANGRVVAIGAAVVLVVLLIVAMAG